MSDMQALFQTVDELTPEELQRLYQYIVENRVQFTEAKSTKATATQRVLGLHSHLGKAWMSDDFDEPLPDSFWFGEE